MRTVAVLLIVLLSILPAVADQMVVIDLLHLSARGFATSIAGGGSPLGALDSEATDFALSAMQDVGMRARGQRGLPSSLSYSRARSIPDGSADLSHLLPEGLAGPPVAAPNRNALIVRGRPEAIDRMREIVAMLDLPTPMVNVELEMDEVSTSDSRRISPYLETWGWGGEAAIGRRTAPALGYRIGNLAAMLGYDARSSHRRASTATHITGMSGLPLIISAGEARPRIVSEVYYDRWGRRHIHYYPEAVFAGVSLWVLPTVHADDSVTMVLRPMFSEVVGPAQQIGAGDIMRRTMLETTVRVPDGQSLVIGGLDRHLDEMSRSYPASSGQARTGNSSVITVTPSIVRMQGSVR